MTTTHRAAGETDRGVKDEKQRLQTNEEATEIVQRVLRKV